MVLAAWLAAGSALALGPAAVALAPAGAAVAPVSAPAAPAGGPVARSSSSITAASALSQLNTLPVKGRAGGPAMVRTRDFGQAWLDVDRNGCDTRNDILRRDLRSVVLKPGTRGCVVLRGVLAEPYSGRTIGFVRGSTTSGLVQIDHVVALGDAWAKGAQTIGATQRLRLANDPLNLLAVDGALNQQKKASDAASWLPPNKAFRCAYVARQIAVKAKYRLWVTAAEKAAMVRVLGSCPSGSTPTITTTATAPPATAPSGAPSPTASGLDPRFSSCAQAKAAGYGPYRRGVDPEYAWYVDGDGDGIVCE